MEPRGESWTRRMLAYDEEIAERDANLKLEAEGWREAQVGLVVRAQDLDLAFDQTAPLFEPDSPEEDSEEEWVKRMDE